MEVSVYNSWDILFSLFSPGEEGLLYLGVKIEVWVSHPDKIILVGSKAFSHHFLKQDNISVNVI